MKNLVKVINDTSDYKNSDQTHKKINYSIISNYRSQLMGIAIITIILLHFFQDVIVYNKTPSILLNLSIYYNTIVSSIGVDIFLLVSAIGLYFSYQKNSNLKDFYKKRIIRVVIPYIIICGLYWIVKDFFILHKRNWAICKRFFMAYIFST